MGREHLEQFTRFLAEDKEHQAHVKSLAGDMDALAAYAAESGFEVSAHELREYREQSLKLLEARVKQARQDTQAGPGTKAFYALLELGETDSAVAKRLEELGESTREELIAYGKEKGFIFDEQDLDAVGDDILEPSEELSDEELELVAGGTTALASAVVIVGVISVLLFAAIAATAPGRNNQK